MGGNSKGSESIGEEEDGGGQNESAGGATFVVGGVMSSGRSIPAPTGDLMTSLSIMGGVSRVSGEGLL